jgi:PAS domain S-box-containing protein
MSVGTEGSRVDGEPQAGLSPEHYRAVFEGMPGLTLVLAPDLTIVAASDAYLRATLTRRDDVLGKGLFEVFPDNPSDPLATGVVNLRASLERVRETLAPHRMALQRYDIQRPAADGGGFEERFWSPLNTPIVDATGALAFFVHQVEDVTQRVRLEAREAEHEADAARSEKALAKFFELSLELLCIAGTDGYFKRVSPAFAVLGYTEEELCARPFVELVHPDDREATQAELAALAEGKPTVAFENRFRCRDGSFRVLSWTTAPDPSGTLYAVARDVTERHRAEEERARLASIVASSDDAIVSKTLDGIVTSWNRGAELLFGYRADEMLGQPMRRVFSDPGEEARLLERVRASGEPLQLETVRLRRDGVSFPVSSSLFPLRDARGELVGVSSITRDLTREKRALAEKASLEARATTVLDTVLEGIVVIDHRGTVRTFNRGAERIFGYSSAEVVGRNVRMLMPEPHRSRHDGYLERYQETREARLVGKGREVLGVRKDGSPVPLEISVAEMMNGDELEYVGCLRDISERRAAELALADKARELEIAARTDRVGARVMVALSEHEHPTSPAAEVLRVLADEAGYRPLAYYDYDEWRGSLALEASLALSTGLERRSRAPRRGARGRGGAAPRGGVPRRPRGGRRGLLARHRHRLRGARHALRGPLAPPREAARCAGGGLGHPGGATRARVALAARATDGGGAAREQAVPRAEAALCPARRALARGRGAEPRARAGEPVEERVSRRHVARAAHAAQRHHRLLGGPERWTARQARARAGRLRDRGLPERTTPARAHQRHPRPLEDRGREDGPRHRARRAGPAGRERHAGDEGARHEGRREPLGRARPGGRHDRRRRAQGAADPLQFALERGEVHAPQGQRARRGLADAARARSSSPWSTPASASRRAILPGSFSRSRSSTRASAASSRAPGSAS